MLGFFLKGLYDYLSPYKFIVTGSGSLELKQNIVEPLTGRKKTFPLYPLSFEEFFKFKTGKEIDEFNLFCQVNKNEGERILDEYLTFGGYPKVVLAKTALKKREVLEEIYTSYLEKDLSYQYLLKYLAGETGSLLKKAEISRNLGLNIKTLNRYLFLLEKTFVIFLVRPFFRNPTKELTKTPKSYFIDLGLRNFILGNFSSIFQREDKGKVFENFVFRQILEKKPVFGVWFWRTETGAEVDFVLLQKGSLLPIEVKATKEKFGIVGKNLLSFLEKYHLSKALIVHWGEEKIITKGGKKIIYKRIII